MEAYINGIGIISAQHTFRATGFLNEVVKINGNSLRCIEPSYKEFLDPIQARRMGRVVKMSMAASATALKDSGIQMPDAIITGTSMGCVEATEKFLVGMIENEERFLTPISFMQSTHNTVAAQIALQLKCYNYNFTYVHRGFAFESALLDAMLLLEEGSAKNVLIGSHEEVTERNFKVYDRVGAWKKPEEGSVDLLSSDSTGSIAGEGVAFFALSNEANSTSYAKLQGVKTIYKPTDSKGVELRTLEFLNEKGLNPDAIDVVVYGINGDVNEDKKYRDLMNTSFKNNTSVYFKHLCGEYPTSGSFAVWLSAMLLKIQSIPEEIIITKKQTGVIKNILVYNAYKDNHAIFLLSNL